MGDGTPLNKLSVKRLTQLFSPTPPNIPPVTTAWKQRYPSLTDSPPFGLLYSDTLLGPGDYYNHFKFITRRALRRIVAIDRTVTCNLCGETRDYGEHYLLCTAVATLWNRAAQLMDLRYLRPLQALFGRNLELGACHFLTLLWKLIIGCIFSPDVDLLNLEKRLWTSACRTFADRALYLQYKLRKSKIRARFKPTNDKVQHLRHKKSPYAGYSKRLMPLTHVDPYGDVRWSHKLAAELSACKLNRYLSGNVGGATSEP